MKRIISIAILCLPIIGIGSLYYNGSVLADRKIKPLDNSLNFFVIGDWGRKGEADQQEVADAMAEMAKEIDLDFITTVGDNFYLKGVKSTTDPHWNQSWRNVYNDPALEVPWFPAIGNHDYWGNVDAQIEFSKYSDRWNLPSRYYTRAFSNKKREKVARLVFMDTNPLYDGYYRRHWYKNEIFGTDTAAQMAWADSVLALDDYPWEIVIAHHHLASSGKRQGNRNEVAAHMNPLLKKHKVKIYLSGHEHHMEHIRTEHGIHNFISGGGSDADMVHNKNKSVFAKSTRGYMIVSMNPEEIKIWIMDQDNNVLHDYSRKAK